MAKRSLLAPPTFALAAVLLAGCAAFRHVLGLPRLDELSPAECSNVLSDTGDLETLRHAAEQSLAYIEPLPEQQRFTMLGTTVTMDQLRRSIQILLEAIDADTIGATDTLCQRLRLYRVDLRSEIITTGYYTPVLTASRDRSARFQYPLYGRPADLVTADVGPLCPGCDGAPATGRMERGRLVPYYTRGEIEGGAIADSAAVVAWLDDPIEVFFLQIQGSGVLELTDGTQMPVGYAGSNGRAYRSVGKKLVADGAMTLADANMESMKAYLRAHPDTRAEIMNVNERYVFFEADAQGPRGSLRFPVTAGRSLAADPSIYPAGALVFIQPLGTAAAFTPRLAFFQDRGSAITGPGRLDLYLGTGPEAGAVAGALRAPTALYIPLPAP